MFLIYLSLLAGITIYFSYYSLGILIVLEVISIITALIILHRDFNPAYKISFILLVLLLPLVGVVYYYAFGRDKYSKKRLTEIEKSSKINRSLLNDNFPFKKNNNNETCDEFRKVSNIISNYTDMSYFSDTETKLLTPGEKLFDKLKVELKKAKKFIFMEYFIIEPGLMWNEIFEILKEKAASGVDVRDHYEDFG